MCLQWYCHSSKDTSCISLDSSCHTYYSFLQGYFLNLVVLYRSSMAKMLSWSWLLDKRRILLGGLYCWNVWLGAIVGSRCS
jgi:hypothetical protein